MIVDVLCKGRKGMSLKSVESLPNRWSTFRCQGRETEGRTHSTLQGKTECRRSGAQSMMDLSLMIKCAFNDALPKRWSSIVGQGREGVSWMKGSCNDTRRNQFASSVRRLNLSEKNFKNPFREQEDKCRSKQLETVWIDATRKMELKLQLANRLWTFVVKDFLGGKHIHCTTRCRRYGSSEVVNNVRWLAFAVRWKNHPEKNLKIIRRK